MADPGPLLRVDDPEDDRLAAYRDLNDAELRRRREHGEAIFVVEGRIAVRALLGSSFRVLSLLVDDHQANSAADIVAGARKAGAPVYVATRPVVAATVGFPLHRGVVALARRPAEIDGAELLERTLEANRAALICIVEGVNDHENLGALFRNAAAFGVAAVLLDPTCADPLYRRAVRVSLGHVLAVPFGRLAPWPEALASLHRLGILVGALAPHPGPSRPHCTPEEFAAQRAGGPAALVLGAEGAGLSPGAGAAADTMISIPMASGVDSLNVATAAAVALHVITRPAR